MPGYTNSSPPPHPGELREQIDIVQEINTINVNGYPETTLTTVAEKVWAAVDDTGNQRFRAGDSEVAQNTVNFAIRHRSDIAIGMYVLFNAEQWLIVDIGNYSFSRRYLNLKTILNRAVTK